MKAQGSKPEDGSYTPYAERKANPGRYTVPTSFSMTSKDKELIDWLADYFGTNKSDAVRSAVRHMAAHVGYLERSR